MSDEKAVVPVLARGATIDIGGRAFVIARQVTREVLHQQENVPFYVEFEEPIYLSDMNPEYSEYKDADGNGVVPDVANVINLDTGEAQILIINKVLGSELTRNYPDHSYVGKWFGVMQTRIDGAPKRDKRYRTYKIIELKAAPTAPGGATPEREIDATTVEAVDNAKKASKGKHAS